MDYVIEQVGQCLRLIGAKVYTKESQSFTVTNGAIKLPCYVDRVEQVYCGAVNIPFHFKGGQYVTFDSVYEGKTVEVNYSIYQEDNNGFPLIASEEEYFACYHWVLYQHFNKLFAKGLEKGDRLQWFTQLKDKYILQAKSYISRGEMQQAVNTIYSTYNRIAKDGNSTKYS